MLKTLKDHDRTTAELVLSAYTNSLLPSPGINGEEDHGIDFTLYKEVKEEIHHLLRVSPSSLSQHERGRVFEFLAREMSEVALAGSDVKRIKDQLGERGQLRTDLYEIEFEDSSFRFAEMYGIRKKHVIEAIRHPDLVEEVNTLSSPLVLYLKTHNNMNERDRFSLVVTSVRIGSTIYVRSAFRIYHSDVGVSIALSPTSLLKALAETYGMVFRVGLTEAKFLSEISIEESAGTKISDLIQSSDHHRQLLHGLRERSSLSRLHILRLVFVIDRISYAADLRKRGVHVGDVEGPSPLPDFIL